MRALAGWLIIGVLVLLGLAAGAGTVLLIVVWAVLLAFAGWLLGREDHHLKATGLPAPWRVTAAQALYVSSGALVLTVGPGWIEGGAIWRALLIGGPVALAWWRLRQVLALPGADRLELALGVVRDRRPTLLRAVFIAGGAILLVGGVLFAVPLTGLPLIAGLAALVVWGWQPASTRQATVERLRASIANAARIPNPLDVHVEPRRWLADSDDVLDEAAAMLPATWLPPVDVAQMTDLLLAAGWHVQLWPEAKQLAVWRAEPVAPLPDRVTLDPGEQPAGLALRVGYGRDPDTGEQGWAWWDPDAADPHALVVGPTRSGKSVLLRCLLAQALAGRWDVIIADPKGIDYRWADGLPGVTRASGDRAFEAIDEAVEEMRGRQMWLEEHAAATAANLGEVPDNPFAPCLVLIDETAELLELGGESQVPKERKARQAATLQALGSLARRSRFVQMVMCVATQRPDASIIPGEVRGNLGTRVLTGQGETQHRLMAFGRDDVDPLPPGYPSGRARLMVGGAGPFEIQVPWIAAEDVLAAHQPADLAADTVPAAWAEQHEDTDGDRIALDLGDDDAEAER